MQLKIIQAPSLDRLAILVNAFLDSETDANGEGNWSFHGEIQKLGHEEYTQSFIVYGGSPF